MDTRQRNLASARTRVQWWKRWTRFNQKLIQQLPQKLNRRGYVFLEFDPRQERKLKKLSSNLGYKITIQRDSQGFSRIAYLTLEH